MKKIYLFIVLLLPISCSSLDPMPKLAKEAIDCPTILFASEHRVYMGSPSNNISLDNITYNATINNAVFSGKCFIANGKFLSNLSILFVVKPLNILVDVIKLPYYLAIIDKNQNIKRIEYFFLDGEIKKDIETGSLMETEFIETIAINDDLIDEESNIIFGFMLDKKRNQILN